MKTPIRLLLFLVMTTIGMYVKAQEKRTISGIVQDSASRGIPDVSVRLKDSKTGAVTDAQGNFKIACQCQRVLCNFHLLDMLQRKLRWAVIPLWQFHFKPANNALSEVVVTGFGTRTNTRKLSYSVTEVKGIELPKPIMQILLMHYKAR